MQYIIDWVMQIILFIVIGTIVQMILPANSFKKYTEMIIGLFLLFIFLKPIVFFMTDDFIVPLSKLEQYFSSVSEVDQTINLQNDVLELERDAYIWNEVRDSMIELANNDSKIGFVVEDIQLIAKGETLEEVIVYTNKEMDNHKTSIEQVQIASDQNVKDQDGKEEKMIKQLRNVWELEDVTITIKYGRGLS